MMIGQPPIKPGYLPSSWNSAPPGIRYWATKSIEKGSWICKRKSTPPWGRWIFSVIPDAFYKREELKAMEIAADALMAFAFRHSRELAQLAQ